MVTVILSKLDYECLMWSFRNQNHWHLLLSVIMTCFCNQSINLYLYQVIKTHINDTAKCHMPITSLWRVLFIFQHASFPNVQTLQLGNAIFLTSILHNSVAEALCLRCGGIFNITLLQVSHGVSVKEFLKSINI